MPEPRPVVLPMSGDAATKVDIPDAGVLVLVGANGCGKSRLGAWIEQHPPEGRETHRISAQRMLTFQDAITPMPIQKAENLLRFGNPDHAQVRYRISGRWGQKPTSHLLNDYNHLLSVLLARDRKRDAEAIRAARAGKPLTADSIRNSELDTLLDVWSGLFPQRDLVIADDAVKASVRGGSPYDGTELSDGERVAIYLVAQALCAPMSAILVIDEPEIHLHRAIQGRLWDALEAKRPDCTFVYITHDLDFASERHADRLIWMREFDGATWIWSDVPDAEDLPEALVLEVLGSRAPILFVEGEKSSLERIYRALYPNHTVISRGSCESVIRTVRAVRQPGLGDHRPAFGLIDRDHRSDEEVAALEAEGVYFLPVAEIENLMCLPEVLEASAVDHGGNASVAAAQTLVLDEFTRVLATQAAAHASREAQFLLGRLEAGRQMSRDDLVAAYRAHVASVDVGALYDAELGRLRSLLKTGDYESILVAFNQKGLPNRVAPLLGRTPSGYREWFVNTVTNVSRREAADGLRTALMARLPVIPGA